MEKVNLSKDYWNLEIELGVAKHFSKKICIESQTKILTSAFFEKERNMFLHISLEFAYTCREANTSIKTFQYDGNW